MWDRMRYIVENIMELLNNSRSFILFNSGLGIILANLLIWHYNFSKCIRNKDHIVDHLLDAQFWFYPEWRIPFSRMLWGHKHEMVCFFSFQLRPLQQSFVFFYFLFASVFFDHQYFRFGIIVSRLLWRLENRLKFGSWLIKSEQKHTIIRFQSF